MRTKLACILIGATALTGCGGNNTTDLLGDYQAAVDRQDWRAVCETLDEDLRVVTAGMEGAILAAQGDKLGALVARQVNDDNPGMNCHMALQEAHPYIDLNVGEILETDQRDDGTSVNATSGHWYPTPTGLADTAWIGDALAITAGGPLIPRQE